MWNDPYIAQQMLEFHLAESHDIASRRPDTISDTVQWITRKLNLTSEHDLLDLGCGPGLYTRRFAERGVQVTGVDYSQNSIDYARNHDHHSQYVCQNYTELTLSDNSFDVIMMIYGDLCVLSPVERDHLLANIKRWLKPRGAFIFDVTTPQVHAYLENYIHWSVEPNGGFWKPSQHLVLEQGFVYPDDITMQQYTVVESDGQQTLYRNWYQDYTYETLTALLIEKEYNQHELFSDLTGKSYTNESDWIGVIAKP